MAGVFLKSLDDKWIQLERNTSFNHEILLHELKKHHKLENIVAQVKFFIGCQEIRAENVFSWPAKNVFITSTLLLAGGKGGFGSMLRAIGAQIEKTTNREACRDLSGRRLRDINEEKRLKEWVAKQADREREREERKQKKLEKLRQEYQHEFHDPEYFKARSDVTEKVHEALEQGIHASISSTDEPAQRKRKAPTDGPALKKTALWVGVSDEETSDMDSDVEAQSPSPSTSNENSQTQSSYSSQVKEEKMSTEDEQKPEVHLHPSEIVANNSLEIQVTKTELPEKSEELAQTKTEEKPITASTSEPSSFDPINLDDFDSAEELETLGLNHLKFELQRRGMKCGGTLPERASRLFCVKGKSPNEIDPNLLAKPQKKK